MAIAFVQKDPNSLTPQVAGTDTVVMTFDSQPGAGNFVAVVLCWYDAGVTVSGVADNQGGSSYSLAKHQAIGNALTSIYYRENITSSGTWTVTATFSAAVFGHGAAYEFSGVATSSALDGSNSGTGASSTPSAGSITPASGLPSVFIGGATTESGFGGDPDTGFTKLHDEPSNGTMPFLSEYKIGSGATTVQFLNTPSVTWTAVGAAFKEASGGFTAGSTPTGLHPSVMVGRVYG